VSRGCLVCCQSVVKLSSSSTSSPSPTHSRFTP